MSTSKPLSSLLTLLHIVMGSIGVIRLMLVYIGAVCTANFCENEDAVYYSPLNKCYWINSEITDAATGQTFCESRTNGHLADLIDEKNQEFIVMHVIPQDFPEHGSIWLGIHNNLTSGTWTAFNGDNLTWTNWNNAYAQPDNDGECAYMSPRYGWEWFDLTCSRRSHSPHALCEVDGILPDTTVTEKEVTTTFNRETSTQTTTRPPTTKAFNYARCKCYKDNTTLHVAIEEMKKTLQVEKKTTMRYRKKFECADDKRTSSKAIGSLGLVFCVVAFGLPVALDLLSCIGCYSKPSRSRVRKPLIRLNFQN